MSEPEPILCYRCGQPGHVEWCDVRAFNDPEPVLIRGESYCLTPGCTDEDGSRRLEPLSPAEIAHRADRAWLDHQWALTEGHR